jgi:hypothetical protein
MPKLYLLFAIALWSGCIADTSSNETLEELKAIRQEVSSLSDSISTLKDSLKALQTKPAADTVLAVQPPAKEKTHTPSTPAPSKPKPTPEPIKPKPATQPSEKDTIYHKYVNGKVSVKITPWVNQERNVLFYDLYGNQTFALEEVRHSYSISVDLKFAPNGSVSTALVHTNPGASMYWHETTITLDTTNEPISKIDRRYPQNSLDDIMNEKWVYWDKKSKSWKQQEVME